MSSEYASLCLGYAEFREVLVTKAEINLDTNRLAEIKHDFREQINSDRGSSNISSFRGLLSLLEKRDLVTERSVAALRGVAALINDDELRDCMMRYEEYLANVPGGVVGTSENVYASSVSGSRSSREGGSVHSSRSARSVLSEYTLPNGSARSMHSDYSLPRRMHGERRLPETVISLICDSIGSQWNQLARKLSIREGDIDALEVRHPRDLKARVRAVLALFQERTCPDKHEALLLDALERARRKDLREKVNELLARRY